MSLYGLARALVSGVFHVLYRVRVVGRENEPAEGAYVSVANHISFLDPIFVSVALRRKQRFLAKRVLTTHAALRAVFRVFDVLVVQEGESNLSALREAIKTLREGRCVGLFPQGKRIPCEDPLPEQAMGGLVVIANGAKAPVLPVSIIVKGNKPRPFRKTLVRIGEPIPYEVYHAEEQANGRNAAAAACFARVCGPVAEGSR